MLGPPGMQPQMPGGPSPGQYPSMQFPGNPSFSQTAHLQSQQLRSFWEQQMQEIHEVGADAAEFKNHQLPLARIKKIMKSDEDVRMISAEAPVLFARACEMFILELTLRSWNHSEENKRRTLQRNDIAAAITRTDIFDFLVDIVPREDRGDEGLSARPSQSGMPAASINQSIPYNWPPGMMAPGPANEHALAQPQASMAPMDHSMLHYYLQQQQQQQSQQQPQQHPQLPQGQQLSQAQDGHPTEVYDQPESSYFQQHGVSRPGQQTTASPRIGGANYTASATTVPDPVQELRECGDLAKEAAEILWEMAAMGDTGEGASEMLGKSQQLQAQLRGMIGDYSAQMRQSLRRALEAFETLSNTLEEYHKGNWRSTCCPSTNISYYAARQVAAAPKQRRKSLHSQVLSAKRGASSKASR
ncbi:hypothetical protein WJX84_001295 [Apatococcus fuscideae]|uniref:Transcription factor CBF/NF-Y/archaeal histone domain-containing protein n=1 Tax=Apatococcus fuscideae TaxID=2026836 RepID=A0AAW1T100_9CHLO